jgi:mannose-6-phosphate isomerase-like protein (cupin superfamily)
MLIRREGTMKLQKKLFEGKGQLTIEPLFMQDEFTSTVRFGARVTLPPGSSIGLHTHTDEDELYFILTGRGTVTDGETGTAVSGGCSILTRSGETHSIENTGQEDLVLLAVIPQSPTG